LIEVRLIGPRDFRREKCGGFIGLRGWVEP
jgi:hypothetical protein